MSQSIRPAGRWRTRRRRGTSRAPWRRTASGRPSAPAPATGGRRPSRRAGAAAATATAATAGEEKVLLQSQVRLYIIPFDLAIYACPQHVFQTWERSRKLGKVKPILQSSHFIIKFNKILLVDGWLSHVTLIIISCRRQRSPGRRRARGLLIGRRDDHDRKDFPHFYDDE